MTQETVGLLPKLDACPLDPKGTFESIAARPFIGRSGEVGLELAADFEAPLYSLGPRALRTSPRITPRILASQAALGLGRCAFLCRRV